MDFTLTELLSYATVRIEFTTKNNQITGGTGYLFELNKMKKQTPTRLYSLQASKLFGMLKKEN